MPAMISLRAAPYTIRLDAMNNAYLGFQVAATRGLVIAVDQERILTGRYYVDSAQRTLGIAVPDTFCASEIPLHYHVRLQTLGMYTVELNAAGAKPKLMFVSE